MIVHLRHEATFHELFLLNFSPNLLPVILFLLRVSRQHRTVSFLCGLFRGIGTSELRIAGFAGQVDRFSSYRRLEWILGLYFVNDFIAHASSFSLSQECFAMRE